MKKKKAVFVCTQCHTERKQLTVCMRASRSTAGIDPLPAPLDTLVRGRFKVQGAAHYILWKKNESSSRKFDINKSETVYRRTGERAIVASRRCVGR